MSVPFSIITVHLDPKLKSSVHKCYGRHHDLVERNEISISQMTMDLLLLRRCFLSSITAKMFTRLVSLDYMSITAGIL